MGIARGDWKDERFAELDGLNLTFDILETFQLSRIGT